MTLGIGAAVYPAVGPAARAARRGWRRLDALRPGRALRAHAGADPAHRRRHDAACCSTAARRPTWRWLVGRARAGRRRCRWLLAAPALALAAAIGCRRSAWPVRRC
ncbi:MAG: hypothetical protein MZW92_81020 [Comamonadaceae bacterium]|nr:hypothetical protein [Comamonadaceae bacterium]